MCMQIQNQVTLSILIIISIGFYYLPHIGEWVGNFPTQVIIDHYCQISLLYSIVIFRFSLRKKKIVSSLFVLLYKDWVNGEMEEHQLQHIFAKQITNQVTY